jgi:RNA polymerase sigma-70 factor (ECF subfamily)
VTTPDRRESGAGQFKTTNWAVVVRAADRTSPEGRQALAELCQSYWYPIYVFVRRRGYAPEAAEDLTQGFFVDLLTRGSLGIVDPARGRFRSFLIKALEHFLSNSRGCERRLKRGWGRSFPIDFRDAEGRYVGEPAHDLTPERLFERRWALTLLGHSLDQLEREIGAEGKTALFEQLKPTLSGEPAQVSYAKIGAALDMTEGAVRVAAHRLRKRFGTLIRQEIARTVAEPNQIEEEIRDLFRALRRETNHRESHSR